MLQKDTLSHIHIFLIFLHKLIKYDIKKKERERESSHNIKKNARQLHSWLKVCVLVLVAEEPEHRIIPHLGTAVSSFLNEQRCDSKVLEKMR